MIYEVEQKFRTSDHAPIKARLLAMGGSDEEPQEQEDSYLAHPSRDFAVTGEALRVRRVGDWNAITYKGAKRSGPTKTREEIEVSLGPGQESLDGIRKI